MRYLIAMLVCVCLSSPALAKHHHHHYHHHHRHYDDGVVVAHNFGEGLGAGLVHMLRSMPDSRPNDCYGIPWCGCWMRHVQGVVDKTFNLAVEWAHWGRPTQPHVGAIVVWRHHVGVITGGSPGNWVVTSGNDGHAVRSRHRSLAGAIAFRE